ncbi:DUF6404 family protein [Aliikangiella marina]|uniref:DUF6404 family protein n=1 Tax=Aliikangiella marina TaxID=1712262 RepID=UPI003CCC51D6
MKVAPWLFKKLVASFGAKLSPTVFDPFKVSVSIRYSCCGVSAGLSLILFWLRKKYPATAAVIISKTATTRLRLIFTNFHRLQNLGEFCR